MKPEVKSPLRALLLSALIFPGAGQIYNGDRLKGYLLIALGLVLCLLIVLKAAMPFISYYQALFLESSPQPVRLNFTEHIPALLVLLGVLAAVWIYGMVDAYWVGKNL